MSRRQQGQRKPNLKPRDEHIIIPETGYINHRWQAFFNEASSRVGKSIADLDLNGELTASVFSQKINEILDELRLQRVINNEAFTVNDQIGELIQAVTLIPGAGEFVYGTTPIAKPITSFEQIFFLTNTTYKISINGGRATNLHGPLDVFNQKDYGKTDYAQSLNILQKEVPKCKNISLIVSWFGSDLRVEHCTLKPKVEVREYAKGSRRRTLPFEWKVAGLTRRTAELVSSFFREGSELGSAYGGTPYDRGVIEAIKDINARGLKCTFNPFILMDISPFDELPDPYSSGSQGAYPWRGRITCYPGPDQQGTADKTAAARAQVNSFLGAAQTSDFSIDTGKVVYSGPDEWSYRRFILHYAHLCKLAGEVDAFLIGSEMRGLSWLRDETNAYPFVEGLVQLASDVKAVLGPDTKVTYGADWSEYFGHQPSDGSGDVIFHLDPLWASDDIDAIGIDCYWPLADWRDGDDHLDLLSGVPNIYDLDYLKGNIKGGEGYDWYYTSRADRDAQTRTPITDGAYNKPWTYRFKDIWSWWENQHYNRVGGVEETSPTSWVPKSKPIWFTEIGCGAVDKGANQPNKFSDPKSSEDGRPYYSNGTQDNLMQRRFIKAFIVFFDHEDCDFETRNNPVSPLYDGPMVAIDRIYIYTWDARPFPQFPLIDRLIEDHKSRYRFIWLDFPNWNTGHWLTGRIPEVYKKNERNSMAVKFTPPPRNPYIIDPKTAKISADWEAFFESIERRTMPAISDVSTEPSAVEIAVAINNILAALRAQRFIAQ